MTAYLGFDVLDQHAPDRVGTLTYRSRRRFEVLDNRTGKRGTFVPTVAPSPVRDFTWTCSTRAHVTALKAFVLARKGRAIPFWSSSYQQDLTLAVDAASGADALVIKWAGYVAQMFPNGSGRRHIVLYGPGQTMSFHEILGASETPKTTETLTIYPPTPRAFTAASTIVSFLNLGRLEDDVTPIRWTSGGTSPFARATFQTHEIPGSVPPILDLAAGGDVIASFSKFASGIRQEWVVRLKGTDGSEVWSPVQLATNIANPLSALGDTARSVSDGSGGVFIVFIKITSGTRQDLYVQRIDKDGNVLWTSGGVAVCTTSSGQRLNPRIALDGAGGILVAWSDTRSGTRNFVQRIDADGNVLWTADGVQVSAIDTSDNDCEIASDGDGGAIVAWISLSGSTSALVMQRLSGASGAKLWGANGVAQSSYVSGIRIGTTDLVDDGDGGVILGFITCNPAATANEFKAVRVDSDGALLYGPTALNPNSVNGSQWMRACSDGRGGAWFAWHGFSTAQPVVRVTDQCVVVGGITFPTGGLGSDAATSSIDAKTMDSGGVLVVFSHNVGGSQYATGFALFNESGDCIATFLSSASTSQTSLHRRFACLDLNGMPVIVYPTGASPFNASALKASDYGSLQWDEDFSTGGTGQYPTGVVLTTVSP